jgi:hypothetical protein
LKAHAATRRLEKASMTEVIARLAVICPTARCTFSSQRNLRSWRSEKAP